MTGHRPRLLQLYFLLEQFTDPRRLVRALRNLPRFVQDYRAYEELDGRRLRLSDVQPQLHDRTPNTPFDAHYLFVNAWAARQIRMVEAELHVDVGSQLALVTIASAFKRMVFLDFRPAQLALENLLSVAGDVTRLPLADRSVASVSCLHVAEHIGLGRYGDPLDPLGTLRAAGELQRVLAPGGTLLFALPVGRPRVNFNAHRVHDSAQVLAMFPQLQLVGYSFVDDAGRFHQEAAVTASDRANYACGMFHLVRP